MADYPTLSYVELAEFSGRPQDSYDPAYSDNAIAQATLLFKIGTCLASIPDDNPLAMEMTTYAISAMADYIVLNQPYQDAIAKPFSSETLGSYSYSKMAQSVSDGETTGVPWFDLAIKQLSVCDQNDQAFFYGGIEMMEHDAVLYPTTREGNLRFLSPGDLLASAQFGFPINKAYLGDN